MSFNVAALVQVEGCGGCPPISLLLQAMGFRKVTDLTDFTTGELLDLIKSATDIIRARLSGELSHPQITPGSESVQTSDEPAASSSSLKNPSTCEYRCRHCNAQCFRVTAHTYHACSEHRHLR